jgi:hypothetical protein
MIHTFSIFPTVLATCPQKLIYLYYHAFVRHQLKIKGSLESPLDDLKIQIPQHSLIHIYLSSTIIFYNQIC